MNNNSIWAKKLYLSSDYMHAFFTGTKDLHLGFEVLMLLSTSKPKCQSILKVTPKPRKIASSEVLIFTEMQ